jgi:hypothetical protein
MDKEENPMPVEQIKARLTRLETERRAVEAQLAEARAAASTKATHPETLNELESLIDDCDTGSLCALGWLLAAVGGRLCRPRQYGTRAT